LGARTESGAEVAAWDKAQNTYHSQILFPRSILRYQATLGSTSPSITNSSEIHLFIVCTSRHCGPSHTVATEGRLRVHRTHIPIMLVLQPHMTVSRSSIHSSPARQAGESSSRCFWRLIIMLAQYDIDDCWLTCAVCVEREERRKGRGYIELIIPTGNCTVLSSHASPLLSHRLPTALSPSPCLLSTDCPQKGPRQTCRWPQKTLLPSWIVCIFSEPSFFFDIYLASSSRGICSG
jgi:hypothetical protein